MTRKELEKKLTPKQKIFCKEYVVDWNASRAARSAGYSKRTASSIGSENLGKPEIKAYIELIKGNLEELSGVSKLKNLRVLAKVAYSNDISDLHDSWVDLKDYEGLSKADKAGIKSIEHRTIKRKEGINDDEVEVEQVKIECYDKRQYIETINKMMGYDEAEVKVVEIKATKLKWGDEEIEV